MYKVGFPRPNPAGFRVYLLEELYKGVKKNL